MVLLLLLRHNDPILIIKNTNNAIEFVKYSKYFGFFDYVPDYCPIYYNEKRLSCILNYKESTKSAKRTADSGASLGASLGFHATTNRTDADFTS